jgi:hypothetical protein
MDFSNDEIKIVDTIPIMNTDERQKKIVKCFKIILKIISFHKNYTFSRSSM